MSPVNPPTLEDSQESPPKPPAQPKGPALDTLTSAQIEQDCSDLVLEILSEVVQCSEDGSHGPTGPQTSCVSATCSLGGVSTPQDITLALSNLVSSNSRYKRKTYFNCGSCQAILRNTTACHCGSSQDFPAILFKKAWKKALGIFTKLEKTSTKTITPTTPTQVSLHKWARYILTCHGVMFAGLLSSTSGMTHRTTCSCFMDSPPVTPTLEIETEETLALDTSGSLFLEQEVGTTPK